MSNCEFENKVQTLKVELMAGQTTQAANLLREELYCNPAEARALINCASMPGTPDQILVGANGQVTIRDNVMRYDQAVGYLPQMAPPCEQPRNNTPPCEQPRYTPPCEQPNFQASVSWNNYGYPQPAHYSRVPCEPQVHRPGNVYDWGRPHREQVNVSVGGGFHFELGTGRHHR